MYTIAALVLVAILVSGRWSLLPAWAGGLAILFVGTLMPVTYYMRSAVGGTTPTRPAVAVSLEVRRLRDYLWWPAETAMAAIIAGSWYLLAHSRGPIDWGNALTTTWAVLGTLPGKIILVRNSFPLPAERTEEHYRWMDAWRRYSLRVMDAMAWFFTVVFAAYALQRGGLLAGWARWSLIGIALAIWLAMAVLLIRGRRRLVAMGRDLRPLGSWSGPFRGAQMMAKGGWVWSAVYAGGILLLLAYFR
jgi:hypothetical protein